MNPETFGSIGYLGLGMAAGVILLWLVYGFLKKRIISNVAMALAIGAWVCALINSSKHVSRIDVDPSEMIAKMEARQQARINAALASREEDVADIAFAEDDKTDRYDEAGMDDAEKKYIDSVLEDGEPAWKKNKKERSVGSADDGSLESMIDDEPEAAGANVEEFEEEEKPEPILMSEKEVTLAKKIDEWNLDLSLYLLVYGSLALLILDYLRRVNIYSDASRPVPIPSSIPNAITPLPTTRTRPEKPRRSMPDEMRWLRQRGDSFIYLTDNPNKAIEVMDKMPPQGIYQFLHVKDEGITDEFIFESLWFRRASFVVDNPARIDQILNTFMTLMTKRLRTKAKVRQTVHIVWDQASPIPDDQRERLVKLAEATGFSLFLNQTP